MQREEVHPGFRRRLHEGGTQAVAESRRRCRRRGTRAGRLQRPHPAKRLLPNDGKRNGRTAPRGPADEIHEGRRRDPGSGDHQVRRQSQRQRRDRERQQTRRRIFVRENHPGPPAATAAPFEDRFSGEERRERGGIVRGLRQAGTGGRPGGRMPPDAANRQAVHGDRHRNLPGIGPLSQDGVPGASVVPPAKFRRPVRLRGGDAEHQGSGAVRGGRRRERRRRRQLPSAPSEEVRQASLGRSEKERRAMIGKPTTNPTENARRAAGLRWKPMPVLPREGSIPMEKRNQRSLVRKMEKSNPWHSRKRTF
mmetsp:Transcript_9564/g.23480  ORF Transcript_9564/g.23480 Transcript_9564/m.23480 type:complete len:308 (-) Transcript_9564:13-936(-)